MKFLKHHKKINVVLLVAVFIVACLYKYQHTGLCVIGYHAIVSDEDKKGNNDPYYMSVSQFEKQMAYLYQNHYSTLTMQEVEDYMNGKTLESHSIVLTFDDGYENFNTIVKPILKKYHFKATCFVIGDKLSKKGHKFLKLKELKNDDTAQYYSHSYGLHYKENHTFKLQEVSLKTIDEDFKKNKVDSQYFAYPFGKDRKDIDETLKNNGVHLAFTYNNFRNVRVSDNPYHLPRYMIVSPMPFFYFKYVVS